MAELGPIEVTRRRGDERFRDGGRDLGFDLAGFWQWSFSDVVNNATRGILAEYLVAQALGAAHGVREQWAAHDLTTAEGTRIEVKSSAYIQSWHQDRPSAISFRVRKTRAWNRGSSRHDQEARWQADVYVFALLSHCDQSTLDPLDVSQWTFFVVPIARLDNRSRCGDSITLRSLRAMAGEAVTYHDLPRSVRSAAAMQR